jgi:hypothetical protein
MAEFVLLHARLLTTMAQESALEVLRQGDWKRAWEISNLYPGELRVLWQLLFIWELKEVPCQNALPTVLQQFQQQQFPVLGEKMAEQWQQRYAAYLLAQVVEVDEDIFTTLPQERLHHVDLGVMCEHLTLRGYFAAAKKMAQAIRWNTDAQEQALERVALAQIELGKLDDARETARQRVLSSEGQSKLFKLIVVKWIAMAREQVQAGKGDEALKTLEVALQTAQEIRENREKADALREIARAHMHAKTRQEARVTLASIRKIAQALKSPKRVRPSLLGLAITPAEMKVWADVSLQSMDRSLYPPLLQNRACHFYGTRLLSDASFVLRHPPTVAHSRWDL